MPTTTLQSFNTLSNEAETIHKEILRAAQNDPEIMLLYKGSQLLFSPLIHKPKILLVGFNPGGGYFKHHQTIIENFEPMAALEYYLNQHSLGEQSKRLFQLAGREADLKNATVKTNFYYWATDNVADFKQLLNLLPKDLSERIFHNARVWTKGLIETLQPEMIVAEGFKAFDELEILFPEKLEQARETNYQSFVTPAGLTVLGYKRNQGSIIGKEELAEIIKSK